MIASRILVLMITFLTTFVSVAETDVPASGELSLVSEKSLNILLRDETNEDKNEASGVIFANNRFYVIFDNYSEIAQVDIALEEAKLFGTRTQDTGYEGISYLDDEFYLVEESINNDGAWNARLSVVDKEFELESKKWLKYNFQSDNKGFEGITVIDRDNKKYVLALCEGNDCEAGATSKISGAGRIKVFEKKRNKWKYIASIRLPKSLSFIDYSGIAMNDNDMLAITSQESSAIWITKLDLEAWAIAVPGKIYEFPKNADGNIVYCNIEGVAWIAENQIITVSDAKKGNQPERCKTKEQSIHIMAM